MWTGLSFITYLRSSWMVRTTVGLPAVVAAEEPRVACQRCQRRAWRIGPFCRTRAASSATDARTPACSSAPAGLVVVEKVAAEEERVNLEPVRVLQDLLERHEGVVLADLVVLVHAQVVVRGDQQPQLATVGHDDARRTRCSDFGRCAPGARRIRRRDRALVRARLPTPPAAAGSGARAACHHVSLAVVPFARLCV